jgi:cell division protein FtsQ
MAVVGLLLLLLWFQRGWIASDRWPVRWIEISAPEQRVSAEQIRARLLPALGRGFFGLDLAAMAAQLEDLGWVASVQVQRRWPDTVLVTVSEHRPVAYWNGDRLISDRGVVFDGEDAAVLRELPQLSGPPARRETVIQQWLAWRETLLPTGRSIRQLALSERGSWTVSLDSGVEIALGREAPDARLRRLVAVWPSLGPWRDTLTRIDLRYSNGLALRLATPAEPVDTLAALAIGPAAARAGERQE